MFKKLLATLAVALFGTGVSAATYNPVGVQNDVAASTVFGGGWTTIYQGVYGDTFDLDAVLANAGSKVMLAARLVGSDTFDVLATIDSSVFLPMYTDWNATVSANGAEWYKNGYSVGFAGAGDTIYQTSADVVGSGDFGYFPVERDRLSWHSAGGSASNITVNGGWRSGSNIWLNGSTDWERLVLTNDIAAVPVPATLPLLLAGLGGIAVLRRKKA